MREERNDEQVAADADLTVAIERAMHAYWPDGASMAVDYLVLVARENPDSPGETTYNYLMPNGSMSWHRTMGLMTTFEKLMSRDLLNSHSSDTD